MDELEHARAGRPTDDAMTRSEEQLRVGTTVRAVERIRITRRVVTEEVTVTVPVSREELHVERLPADGSAPVGAERPRELVIELRAEEPVIATRVVPVERVRVTTEVVTRQQAIAETLRKEEIAVEQVAPSAAPTTR